MLHALLGLTDAGQIRGHPKSGASWEGLAIEQTLALLETRDAYFWATHGGAELDLIQAAGKRFGFEFKFADAPSTTKSMRVAATDLQLEHLWVVYPGRTQYALDSGITAVPLSLLKKIATDLGPPQSPPGRTID